MPIALVWGCSDDLLYVSGAAAWDAPGNGGLMCGFRDIRGVLWPDCYEIDCYAPGRYVGLLHFYGCPGEFVLHCFFDGSWTFAPDFLWSPIKKRNSRSYFPNVQIYLGPSPYTEYSMMAEITSPDVMAYKFYRYSATAWKALGS